MSDRTESSAGAGNIARSPDQKRRGYDRLSLLWPAGHDPATSGLGLSREAAHDIGLDDLTRAFVVNQDDQHAVGEILMSLCQDPAVIRYRQDVIEDLLRNPGLVGRLSALMPSLDALVRYNYRVTRDTTTLHEVIWRVGELEALVECVGNLHDTLSDAGVHLNSLGLQDLRQRVAITAQDETYQRLVRELPDLASRMRSVASITVGINLDDHLRPVEATLLAVNNRKFRSESLLSRLFGNGREWEGIAQLHEVPHRTVEGSVALPISPELGRALDPMMVPLFRDLAAVLEKAAQPVASALGRYVGLNSGFLADLRHELPFYFAAVRVIDRLRTLDLPVCRPTLAPQEERICHVLDGYNANLALQKQMGTNSSGPAGQIITNDISFGPDGRILILTGPNQGGKTTYIQGIGLIQVMAQAGLHVPGTEARISPVDGLYTHFPVEEKLERSTGRFGDEAQRLHAIFLNVTRYSLVLLNESLSSTSAGESLYLSQDVLRVLRLLGARAIFSTHIHELAAGIDELNRAEPGDSRIVSLVASPIKDTNEGGRPETHRNYRVVAAPPMGRSYAREIAERYGVSYDQLRSLLNERGALAPGEQNRERTRP